MPQDVTHVVLSHLHFDHLGGVIDKSLTGEIRPIFTNARFYIQEREWELALAPTDERLAAAYRHAPECLRALEKVTLIDGDTEIVAHVRTAISGGHTDLHQCVVVESGGTGLIHWGHCADDLSPATCVECGLRYQPAWDHCRQEALFRRGSGKESVGLIFAR